VHPDVVSLEVSQAEAVAEVAPDGRVRLVVTHRPSSSRRSLPTATPRPSNLTGSTSFGAADLFSLHSSRPSARFDDRAAAAVRGRSAAAVVPTTSHDPAAMFEWSAAAASELSSLPAVFHSGRARRLVPSEVVPSGGSLRGQPLISEQSPFNDHK
jgi:auxin efflux carrier family protein